MAERTRLDFHVQMDVEPRPGQSAEEASDELSELFTQYLTDKRLPFFEDYGITQDDLTDARSQGEPAGPAGYDGPFAMDVTVKRLDEQHEQYPSNVPSDLVEAIEVELGPDANDYALYVLDGQTAQTDGGEDDWHDAIAIIDPGPGRSVVAKKFTRDPNGNITQYTIR